MTPQLDRVRPRVQEAVNREIQERIRTHYGGKKLKYQSPDPWAPNAAFVNCYNGPQESVGWVRSRPTLYPSHPMNATNHHSPLSHHQHSDQLTYLGPRAVIGSLSLGVAREFRVRRIPVPPPAAPSNSDPTSPTPDDLQQQQPHQPRTTDPADEAGQIAIHLPHNSLLVMHADMQEGWKHSVAPAAAVDPHPVAGARRINVTYRHYRDGFHPRHTPRCPCRVPAVLRVVTRKRENWGRYFWMCYAGNVPGREACGFFRWADFDEDGNPIRAEGCQDGRKVGGQAVKEEVKGLISLAGDCDS